MTLANRTALVAGLSGLLAVLLITVLASVVFARSVAERVDQQLQQRARSAAVLAAVGDRIEISELSFVVDGARVATPSGTVGLGLLPDEALPPLEEPGWRTATADGESWRLYAVEVVDVPDADDRTLVEFVEPLGDVRAQLRTLRRRAFFFGGVVAVVVAAIGFVAGRRAARPLTELAGEVGRVGRTPPEGWTVSVDASAPEVADIATALNNSLGRLAVATRRREEALGSARSFASAASHELRTPLQSAMTNLDVALTGNEDIHITRARAELDRMRSSLDAVRRLAEVDLIDERSFEPADLGELADQAVGALGAEARSTSIEIKGPEGLVAPVWVDGVRLAVENLVRNALRHGRPDDGEPANVVITVFDHGVMVDDNGPGIPASDRDRLLRPFERGSTTGPGSGLGLAFADRVAALHKGSLEITDGPAGGARLVLRLG